jgi:hypothetical protein
MKSLLLFCFAAAVILRAEPVTLDLGSRGQLTLYLADRWKTMSTDMGGNVTLTLTPVDDANAMAQLQVSFPEQDRLNTKSRLKLRVETDCYAMAEGSVERKAQARESTLRSGYGFHCDFTDPELVGRPPEKGNYKVMSIGKIRLAPDVLVDLSISADGFRDQPYQEILGAIEGMEYTPARSR